MDQLVTKVRVHADRVEIDCAAEAIADLINLGIPANATITHICDARLTRNGAVLRLIQPDGRFVATDLANPSIMRLLVQSRDCNRLLLGGDIDLGTLARSFGKTSSYINRVMGLAYLAPDIIAAALNGGLRAEIDAGALVRPDAIPAEWDEQRRRFLPA